MRLGNRYAVNQHNKAVATRRSSSRAAETRELGDRYLGPAGPEQTYLKAVTTGGSLGTTGGSLGSYFGAQDVGAMHQDLGKIRQSYFGGQSLGMLSDNEKRLAAIGVLAIVGWFVFGKQIKKGFTSNPPKWSAKARANMRKGLTPAGNKRKRLSAFQRAVRDYMRAGYTKAQAEREAREDIIRR